jgi:hypothetical protein
MPVDGVHVARRTADPTALPASGYGRVPSALCDEQRLRTLRHRIRCCDTWPDLRARHPTLIGRRPIMKKLMILLVFGTMLVGMAGCHMGECWTYAWNSRFHPERNAPRVQAQPCVMVDPCDPCGDPCAPGAQMVTPGPVMVK